MPQALACLSTNRKKKPWALEESRWAEGKVRQSWETPGRWTCSDNQFYGGHLSPGWLHPRCYHSRRRLFGRDRLYDTLSSRPHAAMISTGLDDSSAVSTFRKEVYRRFLSSADYGLEFRQETLVLTSWIGILDRIRSYAKECPKWQVTASKVWEDFFQEEVKETLCVCGTQGKTRFTDHFKGNHMWQVAEVRRGRSELMTKRWIQLRKSDQLGYQSVCRGSRGRRI